MERPTGQTQISRPQLTAIVKIPMTAAGHSALEGELRHRIAVERPRLIQRVQEAIADDTNLAENSDYQIAKAEQQTNEARIVELEDKLARAEAAKKKTMPPLAHSPFVCPPALFEWPL
jgi:Transcription elongation factor, N-terminal